MKINVDTPLLCRDFGDREGCAKIANPANTMVASEYGSDGPDLHFCDPCLAAGQLMVDALLGAIDDGKITAEEASEAIAKHESN